MGSMLPPTSGLLAAHLGGGSWLAAKGLEVGGDMGSGSKKIGRQERGGRDKNSEEQCRRTCLAQGREIGSRRNSPNRRGEARDEREREPLASPDLEDTRRSTYLRQTRNRTN
jgi:hypothetical protein